MDAGNTDICLGIKGNSDVTEELLDMVPMTTITSGYVIICWEWYRMVKINGWDSSNGQH